MRLVLLSIHSNHARRLKWKTSRQPTSLPAPTVSPCSEKRLPESEGDTSQKMGARQEKHLVQRISLVLLKCKLLEYRWVLSKCFWPVLEVLSF